MSTNLMVSSFGPHLESIVLAVKGIIVNGISKHLSLKFLIIQPFLLCFGRL